MAQTFSKKILIDIAHGQKFWNDPTAMAGSDANLVKRIKYATGQITKTAESVNGKQLKSGGKIVAMGDGMVSLYMTS